MEISLKDVIKNVENHLETNYSVVNLDSSIATPGESEFEFLRNLLCEKIDRAFDEWTMELPEK